MADKIFTCFIAQGNANSCSELRASDVVGDIYITTNLGTPNALGACDMNRTSTLKKMAEVATTPYVVLYTKPNALHMGAYSLERFAQGAQSTSASMLYSNYTEAKGDKRTPHSVIDYQAGSLRNDFNFGSVLVIPTQRFKQATEMMAVEYEFAGLYDLRLKLSQLGAITHISEALYTEIELDTRSTGERQFDYVNPANRAVQVEMEQACTQHLKDVGAYLEPNFREVDFTGESFEVEASVIIPVFNRAKTIADAVNSALTQQTASPFNVIIVDNHSTDGTTQIISELAQHDNRVVHIIPERGDLAIGGCWNRAIADPRCGRCAVQLDSDDRTIDEKTLQKGIETYEERGGGEGSGL